MPLALEAVQPRFRQRRDHQLSAANDTSWSSRPCVTRVGVVMAGRSGYDVVLLIVEEETEQGLARQPQPGSDNRFEHLAHLGLREHIMHVQP